jgi:hypothetical protein
VGQQIREEIDRLRAKWVQIAGVSTLSAFDSERSNMHNLMQELNRLGTGNDGPVRRSAASLTESIYRHRMNNEDLAHELLLDPNFHFTEETLHRLHHPDVRADAQERKNIFFAQMEAELCRSPPTVFCLLKCMMEVHEALVDLATPETRLIVLTALDRAAMRELVNCSDYPAIFDRTADVIRRVQASGRAAAFAASSAVVSEAMQSATTQEERAKAAAKAMRVLLESANHCRIDTSNARLALVSRVVADHGVQYELGKFQEKLAAGYFTTSRTLAWLKRASQETDMSQLRAALDDSAKLEAFCSDAFADLLVQNCEIPETFGLDLHRLREMRKSIYTIAVGSAVLAHCYDFNGHGHSMLLLNQTAQYFRDLDEVSPSVEGLSAALLGSAASGAEMGVKRNFVREVQPLFSGASPVVGDCFHAIGQLLRRYLKDFSMDSPRIQAITYFNDKLLDQFRMAHKIRALNFKVHYSLYRDLVQQFVPSEVDQLADRLSLTSIAANLRVVLPVDPVMVLPGFVVADGTLTIEFFNSDTPFQRHQKASTGLMYAQANTPEQRTLITILTSAIREGGDIPPDPELPDDLGI